MLFKSHTFDSSKALSALRNKLLIRNDIVIPLDEMYLQTQVQFDGKGVIGSDGDLSFLSKRSLGKGINVLRNL